MGFGGSCEAKGATLDRPELPGQLPSLTTLPASHGNAVVSLLAAASSALTIESWDEVSSGIVKHRTK